MAMTKKRGIFQGKDYWALILGGSSGIGLATAQQLIAEGMNLCLVHRDRRQDLPAVAAHFAQMRSLGPELITLNLNALKEGSENQVLEKLSEARGRIRLLLHCLTRGNLKRLLSVEKEAEEPALSESDLQHTIAAMGTSLWRWTQALVEGGFFFEDARIIGLTSEGNQRVWPYYAAVSAAKATLESLVRSMAVELAPLGLRTNVVQAGVTDTPSLRLIPGQEQLKAASARRNPLGRLTQPEDVAKVINFLATDEAAWINGALLPVDGGERLR
jgi:enoyl-[acyl-carrier protein] reductase III